jgi:hypothetical protein
MSEPMNDHPKIFTVFGSFVAENHDDVPLPVSKPAAERRRGPLIVLLIAVLLGATIPALAFTTARHLRSVEAARWQQQQPTYYLKTVPAAGLDPALF